MRIGRIPYINCYPVYGAIDRGIVPLDGTIIHGVPTELNRRMASGELDISVVSAVEYARDPARYLLLPDLAISCDGPVRSVLLFASRPAEELNGLGVLVTRSSMTSVALLRLLCAEVWGVTPRFIPGDAEASEVPSAAAGPHEARLVIGDAALIMWARLRAEQAHLSANPSRYPYVYDLGAEWKQWTGLPFVFAVWVAQRTTAVARSLAAHARLIESRDWGVSHLDVLAGQAAEVTGLPRAACTEFLSGLDYRLGYSHLAGLTDFFRRLALAGEVPEGSLAFLPAA